MELIYTDSYNIDLPILKRLLMLGTKIAFINNPYFILNKKGANVMKGDSKLEPLVKILKNEIVGISVEEPWNYNKSFFNPVVDEYYYKDISNPEFISLVIEGIKSNCIDSQYFYLQNEGEFSDFRKWIIDNSKLLKNRQYLKFSSAPEDWRIIKKKDDAFFAFGMILREQSMRISFIMLASNKLNYKLVSLNPISDMLITLRLSSPVFYNSNSDNKTLGYSLMECLVPDQCLDKLHIDEILDFRRRTKDYYEAWEIEMNKLEVELLKNGFLYKKQEIKDFINTYINPNIFKLKREIEKIRDERFNSILKTIKNVSISLIASGTLSSISLGSAIAAFILANLKTPKLTDEIIDSNSKIRNLKKDNGMTYLLEINRRILK